MKKCVACLLLALPLMAEKLELAKLLELAGRPLPATELAAALRDTLGAENAKKGTAMDGAGGEFVWAVETPKEPMLQIDYEPPVPVTKLGGNLWYHRGKLRTGTSHRYFWIVDGKPFGGANNIPAWSPDSDPQPGVPKGKMNGPFVHESKVYPGLKANFWFYVPAQYDGSAPAAVMIWQDGHFHVERNQWRVLDTLDNLSQQKRIPTMVSVFVQPGKVGEQAWRSTQYDIVSDTYSRYILEEILPEVEKSVKLRRDGYSRAITGESSGGICAFNAAWQKPQEFSRVLSWIGTYTAIQWRPGERDGGNIYPFLVRRENKRNIRVWLQDGAEDMESRPGSWPLQNIQMANSLKLREYDYRFSFGVGTHSKAQGTAELPESLTWLWRDYDPAKTQQDFTADPTEKDKPFWRVERLNRTR